MARADRKDAYRQRPARADREMPAVVTLMDPAPGKMRGFSPES